MSFIIHRHRKTITGLPHQRVAVLNRAERGHLGVVGVNRLRIIAGYEQDIGSCLPCLTWRAREVGIPTNHRGQPPIGCLDSWAPGHCLAPR